MTNPTPPDARNYHSIYEDFDSPLMSRMRSEAYGEDIGQHSWVTGGDLRKDMARLHLTRAGTLLDLGCGPCGPLTFIMQATGCSGCGLDLSSAALVAGRRRAESLGIADRLELQQADLDADLGLRPSAFDAAISFDTILHLRDRQRVFGEIARALKPGGRFLFTDAAVVSGSISSEDVASRSMHGLVQFCARGFNEGMLEAAGFGILDVEDRTASLLVNAQGRLDARCRHRHDLERLEGAAGFARYQAYLQSVVSLAERAALSRVMYLAESRPR